MNQANTGNKIKSFSLIMVFLKITIHSRYSEISQRHTCQISKEYSLRVCYLENYVAFLFNILYCIKIIYG
jgi:hypothetical protein